MDETSSDAAFLLVPAGGLVSEADARRYGLLDEAKAIEAPPENKAILYSPENKRKSNK